MREPKATLRMRLFIRSDAIPNPYQRSMLPTTVQQRTVNQPYEILNDVFCMSSAIALQEGNPGESQPIIGL